MTRAFTLAAGAALVLLLAACAPTERETALVRIDDNGVSVGVFEPASLVIEVGTEVRWRNVGARSYGVATAAEDEDGQALIPASAQPWEPVVLLPGDAFAQVFEVPGTYLYWSPEHREQQMLGTIIVEER